uniref:Uncharacterized protein n=1 Tax=Anguilla anguilla TaxID=7936 RepID=A0A0E9Q862_ANGAN
MGCLTMVCLPRQCFRPTRAFNGLRCENISLVSITPLFLCGDPFY